MNRLITTLLLVTCLSIQVNTYNGFAQLTDQPIKNWMKTQDPNFLIYQAYNFNAIAYSNQFTGKGIKLAIIDSGINHNHEEFNKEHLHQGYNYTSNDKNDLLDETGHGTFIAGMLGSRSNNEIGISGLTPDVELVVIKCFADALVTDIPTIIEGIEKAIDLNVDVINLSFCTEAYSLKLEEVIQRASDNDILLIAPSGNDNSGTQYYPASFEEVVSVNSIQVNPVGTRISESYIANANANVTIAAPGDDIMSISHLKNSEYKVRSGSSYATAFVTGAAVMLKECDRAIDNKTFIELLQISSTDYGESGYDEVYGYGLLNIAKLIDTYEAQIKQAK